MTYGQAQARGIPYKAWLYMCEQEDIEREQEEEEAEREFVTTVEAGTDATIPVPDSLTITYEEPPETDPRDEAEADFFTALADPVSREIFPGENPDEVCMCPACSAKYEHDVALARAVLHCPEPIPCSKNHFDIETGNQCPRCGKVVERDGQGREIDPPEEKQLAEAALNSPIARWIKGQLAMERRMS